MQLTREQQAQKHETAKRSLEVYEDLHELDSETLKRIHADESHPAWSVPCSAQVAGKALKAVGLPALSDEAGDLKTVDNWQRLYGRPVMAVFAFEKKAAAMDSEAGKISYLRNFASKYPRLSDE